jgi:hypothetical protein
VSSRVSADRRPARKSPVLRQHAACNDIVIVVFRGPSVYADMRELWLCDRSSSGKWLQVGIPRDLERSDLCRVEPLVRQMGASEARKGR